MTVPRGITLVPEGRRIFPRLTVYENLFMGSYTPRTRSHRDEAMSKLYELFPVLKTHADQKGGTLSGGEQQMLTIARTLMGNPDLLLVDEPTEGLAPLLVKSVRELLGAIAETGATILLSEQNIKFALKSAKDIHIIEKGRIQYKGTAEDLQQNDSDNPTGCDTGYAGPTS